MDYFIILSDLGGLYALVFGMCGIIGSFINEKLKSAKYVRSMHFIRDNEPKKKYTNSDGNSKDIVKALNFSTFDKLSDFKKCFWCFKDRYTRN